jgi:hypothetical protein
MRKVIVASEFPGYPQNWHFSLAIDTGALVFFSGITGVRPTAGALVEIRVGAQHD